MIYGLKLARSLGSITAQRRFSGRRFFHFSCYLSSQSSSSNASPINTVPATAETGYRLSPELLPNPLTSDRNLQRILACMLSRPRASSLQFSWYD